MSEVVIKENAEACLRQALMYLYQEKQTHGVTTPLPMAYNQAIQIVNDVYKNVGDAHMVSNDIDKVKQIQDIIGKLLHDNQSADVRYLAKSLARLFAELII